VLGPGVGVHIQAELGSRREVKTPPGRWKVGSKQLTLHFLDSISFLDAARGHGFLSFFTPVRALKF